MDDRRKRRPAEAEPVVMLLDRRGPQPRAAGEAVAPAEGAVYIAVVHDPAKLAAERSLALHTDAVDALVDLIVELVDSEETDEQGTPSR